MATEPFQLTPTSYTAFDAISLRNLIIQRLNDQGTFTDQNYVGSNLASVIDIVAYAYNTLIYYLNKTSTESMFSEAQLYENISRIVKTIDYKPIGYQTSTLTFQASATGFSPGLYTIPRYSYLVVENIPFSFNEDVTFYINDSGSVLLEEVSDRKLLYQGVFVEHPLFTAAGDTNELFVLNIDPKILVDHFNVFVYVKEADTGRWTTYNEIPSLFLSHPTGRVFERRLNESKKYELKFGDGVAGRKLKDGDQIAVYYLQSRGEEGVVGPHALASTRRAIVYSSSRYNQIQTDINESQYVYISDEQLQSLQYDNVAGSTYIKDVETVESIRSRAPATYTGQYRLVTALDFERFIETNFANFIADVKVSNNWDYLSGYMQYHYDIGIAKPSLETNSLINQVRYSDACNFNNIYICAVPRVARGVTYKKLSYSQKEAILNAIQPSKLLTTEATFVDPIYKAVDFVMPEAVGEIATAEDISQTSLEIHRTPNSFRSSKSIVDSIVNVILAFFISPNTKIGEKMNLADLHKQILAVEGVQAIRTVRTSDTTQYAEGLSLAVWNADFPTRDFKRITTSIDPGPFGYLYWAQTREALSSKIYVKQTTYTTVEY